MSEFLWVCFGSAAGGGARHLLSGWVQRVLGPGFPFGTLAVNVLGSFLIAVVMYAGAEKAMISPALRITLTTGVLGGFTTYSTFSHETIEALRDGAWGLAVANVLVTVVVCLGACFLGWASAKWLLGSGLG